MNYKIGDKIKAVNHFSGEIVEGIIDDIDGHYAIYVNTGEETIMLKRRFWKINKEEI
jgi:hypothetical protein